MVDDSCCLRHASITTVFTGIQVIFLKKFWWGGMPYNQTQSFSVHIFSSQLKPPKFGCFYSGKYSTLSGTFKAVQYNIQYFISCTMINILKEVLELNKWTMHGWGKNKHGSWQSQPPAPSPPTNTTNILTELSRMLATSNACDSWWEWVSACRREVADRQGRSCDHSFPDSIQP